MKIGNKQEKGAKEKLTSNFFENNRIHSYDQKSSTTNEGRNQNFEKKKLLRENGS